MSRSFRDISKLILPRGYAFLGRYLVARCGGEDQGERTESLFRHAVAGLDCVVREEFLLQQSQGKRVLHFGFLDIPLTKEKIEQGELLHARLRQVAGSLYGIDISTEGIENYRSLTGDRDNQVLDIARPDADLSALAGRFDLILLPEVLEHLPNPGLALSRLRELCSLNPGSSLLVTVPNAFSLEHFVSAANGVELVHPDHYYYFSPVTLKKLLTDNGFARVDLALYSHNPGETGNPGITSPGIVALTAPDAADPRP